MGEIAWVCGLERLVQSSGCRRNGPTPVTASKEKKIIVIAGPNGAGKTTFAGEFLPNEAGCPNFVNADLIAQDWRLLRRRPRHSGQGD